MDNIFKVDIDEAIAFISDCYSKNVISLESFERKLELINSADNMVLLLEAIKDLPNNSEENRRNLKNEEILSFNSHHLFGISE